MTIDCAQRHRLLALLALRLLTWTFFDMGVADFGVPSTTPTAASPDQLRTDTWPLVASLLSSGEVGLLGDNRPVDLFCVSMWDQSGEEEL